MIHAYPGIVASVRANRAFLARVVRFLAAEAGIRQFLDIGTGIPAANNTHEVAQSVAPGCRVVYVDYDRYKSGCAHARAWSVGLPEANAGAEALIASLSVPQSTGSQIRETRSRGRLRRGRRYEPRNPARRNPVRARAAAISP